MGRQKKARNGFVVFWGARWAIETMGWQDQARSTCKGQVLPGQKCCGGQVVKYVHDFGGGTGCHNKQQKPYSNWMHLSSSLVDTKIWLTSNVWSVCWKCFSCAGTRHQVAWNPTRWELTLKQQTNSFDFHGRFFFRQLSETGNFRGIYSTSKW